MTIAEAARRAGVGVETIRFYERQGLVAQPAKPINGYRQYNEKHVERIRFLKQCQQFGFTLAEGAQLAASLEAGKANCATTCDLAERKLAELHRKIAEYQALAQRMEDLLREPCRGKRGEECTVVSAIREGA